jgi:hypothetical protein
MWTFKKVIPELNLRQFKAENMMYETKLSML